MPKTSDGGLTPKQRRFVDEYLKDLNGTQAAIRAGYSQHSAHNIAWENVRKPEIQAAIQEAVNEHATRLKLTAERILLEWFRQGTANMGDYLTVQDDGSAVVDLSRLTPDLSAAIQELTVETYMEGQGENAVPVKRTKIKLHHRTKALESLAKYLQMLPNRLELSGPDGGPISTRDETIPIDKAPPELKRAILKWIETLNADGEAETP